MTSPSKPQAAPAASPRTRIVDAIDLMRQPAIRGINNPKTGFLKNPKTIKPVGEIMDVLIAEQYASRHSGISFNALKKQHPQALQGWQQLERFEKDFGSHDSINMALYKKGDATVAVILGVKPGIGELFREGAYVIGGGPPPASHLAAYEKIKEWADKNPGMILAGHSKGATIAAHAALYLNRPGNKMANPALAITPYFPAEPPHDDLARIFGPMENPEQAARHAPIAVLGVTANVPAGLDAKRAVFFKQESIGQGPVLYQSDARNWFEAHDAIRLRRQMNEARLKVKPDLKGRMGPLQPEPKLNALGTGVTIDGKKGQTHQQPARQERRDPFQALR